MHTAVGQAHRLLVLALVSPGRLRPRRLHSANCHNVMYDRALRSCPTCHTPHHAMPATVPSSRRVSSPFAALVTVLSSHSDNIVKHFGQSVSGREDSIRVCPPPTRLGRGRACSAWGFPEDPAENSCPGKCSNLCSKHPPSSKSAGKARDSTARTRPLSTARHVPRPSQSVLCPLSDSLASIYARP